MGNKFCSCDSVQAEAYSYEHTLLHDTPGMIFYWLVFPIKLTNECCATKYSFSIIYI